MGAPRTAWKIPHMHLCARLPEGWAGLGHGVRFEEQAGTQRLRRREGCCVRPFCLAGVESSQENSGKKCKRAGLGCLPCILTLGQTLRSCCPPCAAPNPLPVLLTCTGCTKHHQRGFPPSAAAHSPQPFFPSSPRAVPVGVGDTGGQGRPGLGCQGCRMLSRRAQWAVESWGLCQGCPVPLAGTLSPTGKALPTRGRRAEL